MPPHSSTIRRKTKQANGHAHGLLNVKWRRIEDSDIKNAAASRALLARTTKTSGQIAVAAAGIPKVTGGPDDGHQRSLSRGSMSSSRSLTSAASTDASGSIFSGSERPRAKAAHRKKQESKSFNLSSAPSSVQLRRERVERVSEAIASLPSDVALLPADERALVMNALYPKGHAEDLEDALNAFMSPPLVTAPAALPRPYIPESPAQRKTRLMQSGAVDELAVEDDAMSRSGAAASSEGVEEVARREKALAEARRSALDAKKARVMARKAEKKAMAEIEAVLRYGPGAQPIKPAELPMAPEKSFGDMQRPRAAVHEVSGKNLGRDPLELRSTGRSPVPPSSPGISALRREATANQSSKGPSSSTLRHSRAPRASRSIASTGPIVWNRDGRVATSSGAGGSELEDGEDDSSGGMDVVRAQFLDWMAELGGTKASLDAIDRGRPVRATSLADLVVLDDMRVVVREFTDPPPSLKSVFSARRGTVNNKPPRSTASVAMGGSALGTPQYGRRSPDVSGGGRGGATGGKRKARKSNRPHVEAGRVARTAPPRAMKVRQDSSRKLAERSSVVKRRAGYGAWYVGPERWGHRSTYSENYEVSIDEGTVAAILSISPEGGATDGIAMAPGASSEALKRAVEAGPAGGVGRKVQSESARSMEMIEAARRSEKLQQAYISKMYVAWLQKKKMPTPDFL